MLAPPSLLVQVLSGIGGILLGIIVIGRKLRLTLVEYGVLVLALIGIAFYIFVAFVGIHFIRKFW